MRLVLLVLILISNSFDSISCTIFCSKDQNGNMWAGNNEDFYHFTFKTKIWIKPQTEKTMGHIWFTYSKNTFPQGGVNQEGLFFDTNAVNAIPVKGDNKRTFPGRMGYEILFQMLKTCKTVPQAISLFNKYHVSWLSVGQIHLADAQGNMGIITADSAWVSEETYQVSTNFSLCHSSHQSSKSWRYPIATKMLKTAEPSFDYFTRVCEATCQKKGVSTVYSNVHNLSTGEMWFYYGWDYQNPVKTSFQKMMSMGDTVLMMRDLFATNILVQAYNESKKGNFMKGVDVLNNIKDVKKRQEKTKLLILDAMFDNGRFIGNEELLSNVIEVSDDPEILSIVMAKTNSKVTRKSVEGKLNDLKKGKIPYPVVVILFSVLGVLFLTKMDESKS